MVAAQAAQTGSAGEVIALAAGLASAVLWLASAVVSSRARTTLEKLATGEVKPEPRPRPMIEGVGSMQAAPLLEHLQQSMRSQAQIAHLNALAAIWAAFAAMAAGMKW